MHTHTHTSEREEREQDELAELQAQVKGQRTSEIAELEAQHFADLASVRSRHTQVCLLPFH